MASNGTVENGYSLPNHEDVLIEYVKEKDNLRSDLKEKEQEILKLRSKVYDLNQKLDELKKKAKTKGKDSSATNSPQLSAERLNSIRPLTGKARTPVMRRAKSAKRKKNKNTSKSSINIEEELTRPDMSKYEDVREVLQHYLEVAEKFPDLKLSVLMEAEKMFHESDVNNDGHIDEKEMEDVLTKQGYLLTNAELQKIMKQMDVDESNSIDLMEYLTIMEKIQQRKRVDLPQQLQKSSLCIIQ